MADSRYIILVDDEKNILKSLEREMKNWTSKRNLEIVSAVSAEEGLEILSGKGKDTAIVISDLRMPGMTGSDFLLKVKELYPEIVTILLTGFSEAGEVVKVVRAGVFSYMLKPWDTGYLLAELQKAYDHGEFKRQNDRYLRIMEEELKWAGEMQKALLRPALPHSKGVEFRASYRPVPNLYCGGDYYDVISLASGRYLMIIGDVAGHGVRAAFVTGILKAIIYPEYVRAAMDRNFSPGNFLSWLNDRMNFELRQTSGLIITFFAGVLDVKAGTFCYANAGHTHPFILRSGVAEELPVSGSGIGFASSIRYVEKTVDIMKEDVITLYSDGLTEIDCGEGKCAPIMPSRLFNQVPYARDYHKNLMQAALDQSDGSDFTDDVTLLSVKIV